METIEIGEVRRLLKKGFEPRLIAFEFDLPIELVEKCQNDLRNSSIHWKVGFMRNQYNKMFYGSNTEQSTFTDSIQLSEEEMKKVEEVIATVRAKMDEIKEDTEKSQRKKIAVDVLKAVQSIEKYQLSLEQAEELWNLTCTEQLNSLNDNWADKTDYKISEMRKKIISQLMSSLSVKRKEESGIEELKALSKKITPQMEKMNFLSVSSEKRMLLSKISKIQQDQMIERTRNDFLVGLEPIVDELARGELDLERANQILDEEVKKAMRSQPRNAFSLNEQQQKGRLFQQIRGAIAKKAEKYPVKDPQKTISQLQELSGGRLEDSLGSVVKNYMVRDDYDTARKICDGFSSKGNADSVRQYARSLRREVINNEISTYVLAIIQKRGTVEEECNYFELLESGLKNGNIPLEQVVLGKSEDGRKRITLADVWPVRAEVSKNR